MPMLGHIVHKERELEEINETIGRTKNLIFQALSLYDEFMEIKEADYESQYYSITKKDFNKFVFFV